MKKIQLSVLALLCSILITSCYNNGRSSYRSVRFLGGSDNGLLASNSNSIIDFEDVERKIIYSAYLSLTVKNPDSVNKDIERIAKKYNGYANEIGTYQTIIRVKSDKLDDAIAEISLLGKLQSKTLSGQDVTEEYYDNKIRLENAEKARERYLELLKKAENVSSTLKVEKELERLNETIDLLKGKMNRINHLTEFSTITIKLTEKKKLGLLGYVGVGLYHSVKWLFVRN